MDFLETSAHTTENLSEVSTNVHTVIANYVMLQAFSSLVEKIFKKVSAGMPLYE